MFKATTSDARIEIAICRFLSSPPTIASRKTPLVGGELKFIDNDSNDYKFTGKKRDLETGLDYFGARYYSNGLGRWVSADWSATPVPVPYANFGDPQTLNLYGYVRGLPTAKADP